MDMITHALASPWRNLTITFSASAKNPEELGQQRHCDGIMASGITFIRIATSATEINLKVVLLEKHKRPNVVL